MDFTSSQLTFESLPSDGSGVAMLNGQLWKMRLWACDDIRKLERDVPAGVAQITQGRNGKIWHRLAVPDAFQRATIERSLAFDNLMTALEAAEAFRWDVRELARARLYATGARTWTTVLGDGDTANVTQHEDGTFGMKRQIYTRYGKSYETTASRYKSGESDHSVRAFSMKPLQSPLRCPHF